MELGIYEQIINRLFEIKLKDIDTDRYYIGKEPISKENVAPFLSQYLFSLFKLAFAGLEDDEAVNRGIKMANDNGCTLWLTGDQIRKGAALNAVQIAEYLIKVGNVK